MVNKPRDLTVLKIALALLLCACVLEHLGASPSGTSEYQVEAAFLYHFAKFVTWPPEAFASDETPIVIGVLGENPFGDTLEAATQGKTVNGRGFKLLMLDIKSLSEARRCHLLYIDPGLKRRLSEILGALAGASVLTVSKMERFTESGGMINFVVEDKKVRFEINDEAARKANIRISAKLLALVRHKEHS